MHSLSRALGRKERLSASERVGGGPSWPQAVIFDLDGTLVDSAPDIASALNEVLGRRGLSSFPLEQVKQMIGGGIPALIRRALGAHGVEPHDIDPLVKDMIAVYAERATALTTLYDGAQDELIRLREAGVKLAVCTNKLQDITDIILRDLSVAKYFASVVGARTGRPRKPEPGALQAVLDELGGLDAGQAVMIGDSGADAGAAKALGMPLVLVGFGYCPTRLEDFEPDAIIAGFGELPAALERIGRSRA
jgi:phosphoglycolate phosphatase